MNDNTLQDRLDDGIRAAFTAEQDTNQHAGIVAAWALTCEVAGNDGEVYLHTIRSNGSTAWRVLGMIESFAVDLRHALTKPAGDT